MKLILIGYAMYSIISFLIFLLIQCTFQYEINEFKRINWNYFVPFHIYNNSRLNILGCLMMSIFYILTNPLYCIIYMILYILYLIYNSIYWIMHFGRK